LKSYNLNIAGYKISIDTDTEGLDLMPSSRFTSFITEESNSDIVLKVHKSSYKIPEGAERVFHAPLVEEIDGDQVKTSDHFWSVYKFQKDLFIKTIFPCSDQDKNCILKFSLTKRIWDLYLDFNGNATDPLEYPVDSLILYYLTVIHGDIMVHASALKYAGHGYIFTGVSGRGKTTMAQIWEKSGAEIIHDDRVIIRNTGGCFRMYNTPVYSNEKQKESKISRIFLIGHGSENQLIPVNGANAASLFLANCIQHNWNHEMIARLIGSVSIMCSVIPVFKLRFRPDRNIVDFILGYE
jgi:hypothetical protein